MRTRLDAGLAEIRRADAGLARGYAELRDAQRYASIGRLAGSVVHDFNNLLTVILACGDSLQRQAAGEAFIQREVEAIQRAAERASGLTRQLLQVALQPDRGPVWHALDLNRIVDGVNPTLARLAGESIELRVTLAPELDAVRGDAAQIEQLLANLVANARDAMPRGGRIAIETANVPLSQLPLGAHDPSPGHARCVMLAVRDTGSGMDAATRERAFEPFFTTKGRDQGTGLGLATVAQIAAEHGAEVRLESEPGQGTTVALYFPSSAEDAPVVLPGNRLDALPGGHEQILLVEDDDSLRTVLATCLQGAGYRVLPAKDVVEALGLCEAHPGEIDLLLTDVLLPAISGRQLAALRPDTKVLFMSGLAEAALAQDGVVDAGVALLEKPFTAAGLARRVRAVLDG
jgi:nitrogen-specific signal transduction histidine kinase